MIAYTPSSREKPSDVFQFNAGIDSVNDPVFIGNKKVTEMINMDFNDYGPVARVGYTIFGNAANSVVNAQGAILKEAGDIHVRVLGTKFQKNVAGTWTDVATGLTSIPAILVSYQCSDLTTAALKTGSSTLNSSSSILDVDISGGTLASINIYAGKIVRITSGTGAGQEKLITSNSLNEIFIDSIWETIPTTGSTFDIREVAPHVIFTNGTDIPFKYDGTTKTNLTAWKKFHTLDVAHDRLFGARNDLDYVYVSNIGTDFFPLDNYIPVNQNGDSISNVSKNHEEIVVYKNNSRYVITGYDIDSFQLTTADEKIGCIAPKSVAHGNNYNFFLGYGGIYSINSLNASSTDEGIPISLDITNLILGHSAAELEAAVGWMDSNKYHISIGTYVYVYHIAQSQVVKSHCWSRYLYADPVKSAFVYGGEVYLGGIQTYIQGGNSDNGTVITCTVITGDKALKDKNRAKIFHRDLVNFNKTNTAVQIYVGMDQATPTLIGTYNTTTSEGQMRVMVNKRGKTIRYKYVFPGTNFPEMQTHEQFFNPLSKAV